MGFDLMTIFWEHPIFLSYLILINVLALVVFASDKLSATAHAWRVRERTLLILAVLGGSIGALLAMKIFRHKTSKSKFFVPFLAILLVQVAIVLWVINRPPNSQTIPDIQTQY